MSKSWIDESANIGATSGGGPAGSADGATSRVVGGQAQEMDAAARSPTSRTRDEPGVVAALEPDLDVRAARLDPARQLDRRRERIGQGLLAQHVQAGVDGGPGRAVHAASAGWR